MPAPVSPVYKSWRSAFRTDTILHTTQMDTPGQPLTSHQGRHRLETVGRACALLKAFSGNEEPLTLAEISVRTGFEKTIAFRLVHTLHEEGFLRRLDGQRYCLNIKLPARKRLRIGYAAQSSDSSFSAAVSESLRWAAARNQIDVVAVDNHYSAKAALRNAKRLIAEQVELAMEFQTYAKVAPMISALFRTAGIPLIAVEIPHPGATFYGIDNYRVGLTAGQSLAKWARQNWQGQVDELLLLGLDIAGALPHLRLAGAEAAIREVTPRIGRTYHLDTRGEFLRSFDLVRKHLRLNPVPKTLIVGVNDPAVLGALRAFDECGRSESCAAVGLGAIPEARAELRSPGTRLIGSIAFFPERYGEALIQLATDILYKKHVPPAIYSQHQMITPQNVAEFYPMDNSGVHCDWHIREVELR
jgi:ribose transport system substrate-binding protein